MFACIPADEFTLIYDRNNELHTTVRPVQSKTVSPLWRSSKVLDAANAIAIPSVCLSVRPSVILVIHT